MARALVTGATNGIGKAIAVALAKAGHEVTGTGRNADRLAALLEAGISPLALSMDDPAEIARQLEGREFDILINNAGTMPPLGHFTESDFADSARTVTVNLLGPMAVTRAILPGMVARCSGHVFFLGSIAGHAPYPNVAAYCATKYAISGFAHSLRMEVAQAGVRVTEIAAGRVETELYAGILSTEARAAMYANQTAIQPEDVAAMVCHVLAMPPHVDVTRFDINPTRIGSPTGTK
ncbi:SDR family oxidoreductase [Thioclava sp. FR2]|uniref:SDR family oxidoreductase n=1 Tax=Thioclava sp. FR2 TaxID=3445780 RepID=UPI003EB8508E